MLLTEKTYIARNRTLPDNQNFEVLRKLGLKYIEKFSSKIWTDYNVHDPGINTLEVLSYALTDLGYRTGFEMKDLLTRAGNDTTKDFFKTQEIFACNPVSFDDYRKWLIDINGIENAWVKKYEEDYFTLRCEPAADKATVNPTPPLLTDEGRKINGLYEIRLQLEEDGILGDLNLTEVDFEVRDSASKARLAIVKFIFPLEIKKTYPKIQDDRITELQKIAQIIDFTVIDNLDNTYTITLINGASSITIAGCRLHFQLLSSSETLANIRSKVINDLTSGSGAVKNKYTLNVFDIYHQKVVKALGLIDEAYKKMQQYRNLCEDVYSIGLVQTQQLAVCADIDVEAGADLEEIMGKILYEVDTFLSPPVRFYSLREMYEQGLSTEDVFEGKSYDLSSGNIEMKNGFIKDSELIASDLKTEVRLSDIYRIIMGIPGVKAVTKLQITNYLNGSAVETIGENGKWVLSLSGEFHINLDRLRSKILFYRDNLPLFADKQVAQQFYDDLKMLHKKNRFGDEIIDIEIPRGKYLNLEDYYSIQNDFPLVYGIGRDGLANSETPLRKAQAKQFKAYLLFFDQILANYLSQLANVKELFSISSAASQSYFFQKVYDTDPILINSDDINFPNTSELLKMPDYNTELGKIIETTDSLYERRNRFLDHLLARFAEQFSEYAFVMYQLTGNLSEKDKKPTAQKIAEDKQDFLKIYDRISRDRGKAMQYKANSDLAADYLPAFGTDNISGLQLRASRLLGFDESKNIKFFNPANLTIFDAPAGKWQYSYQGGSMSLALVSEKKDYTSEDKAWDAFENIIMLIDLHDADNNREFIKITPTFEITIIDNSANILARTTPLANNNDAKNEVAKIQADVQKEFMNEGMHIFEHLLLRPLPFKKVVTDTLVEDGYYPMCPHQSPDCADCFNDDYYSFRISVVLPYWCSRFRNMNFRKFAENLIHQETPAHILPKFCWISMKQMRDLETAYQEWFDLNQKLLPNFANLEVKLTELIKRLNKLINIYPVGFLHDCSNPGDRNSVVLGQTSLGSFEES